MKVSAPRQAPVASVMLIAMFTIVVGVLPGFVARDPCVLFADGGHRQAPAGRRIHGKARDELLEIDTTALGTGGHVAGANNRFKAMLACTAVILENGHTYRL